MDLEKELYKLERFLKKQGRNELIEQLRSLNNTDRRNRLMQQAVLEQEIADTKAKDEKLQAAKEAARELNATYTGQLRMAKKIARFIHLLIEDSGKA